MTLAYLHGVLCFFGPIIAYEKRVARDRPETAKFQPDVGRVPFSSGPLGVVVGPQLHAIESIGVISGAA